MKSGAGGDGGRDDGGGMDGGKSGKGAQWESGGSGLDADEDLEDLGEPISELRTLEEDVGAGFIGRLRSALQRRSLVGHMATMAWTASALALFEFLGMIFSVFDPGESQKKEGRTNG